MNPITITPVQDEKDLAKLREFMLKQRQLYPEFAKWVDGKCIPRVESGEYSNLIVIENGIIIGDGIWRPLGSETTEIKNMRVVDNFKSRGIGYFILEQIKYLEANKSMVADVSVDNFSGVEFAVRNGFHIIRAEELYIPGRMEYLIEKKPIYH